MRAAGSTSIAQDDSTCVIFRMAKEAIAGGAVDSVLPLPHVAPALLNFGRLRSSSDPQHAPTRPIPDERRPRVTFAFEHLRDVAFLECGADFGRLPLPREVGFAAIG